MCRWAEAVQWWEKAKEQARADHDLLFLGVVCADYGGNYSWSGELNVALAHAQQGVEIAEKAGSVTTRAIAYAHLGRVYVQMGSYSEAVTSLERSRAIVRDSHTAFEVEPFAAAPLAEAYAHLGEVDRALRTAEEAVNGARQRSPGMQPFAQLALARVSPRKGHRIAKAPSRQPLQNSPVSRGKRDTLRLRQPFASSVRKWRGWRVTERPARTSFVRRIGCFSRRACHFARRRWRRSSGCQLLLERSATGWRSIRPSASFPRTPPMWRSSWAVPKRTSRSSA
jgi:tetratricopeptide (TPR) repeat protein